MAKIVSRDQIAEIGSRVMIQVDWDTLNGDQVQSDTIELSSEEFGKRFTAFLKNGCQFVFGDPNFFSTQPFDPVKFLGEGWSVWKGSADGDGLSGEEDIDLRSDSLTTINVAEIVFETFLNEGEKTINGEERLRRAKANMEFVRFGGSVFLALWFNYQANKENSILEFLYRTKKIKIMFFDGLILRDPYGDRSVLCLCRDDDGEWRWLYVWLGCVFGAGGLSAGCASK